MSRPKEHIQADLSVAYVTAMAVNAGYSIHDFSGKEYGIDMIIDKVTLFPNGKYDSTGVQIQLQLKSSINVLEKDDKIIYDIDSNAYNKFVNWVSPTPYLLILFHLPKEIDNWVDINYDRLLLRKCCYWYEITDKSILKKDSQKRIKIPKSNIFNENALNQIFDKIKYT